MARDDGDMAALARKTWRTLEPIHGMIYFVPEATEEYVAAGLAAGRMGYFASRAAPMGAVTAEVVIATFYNFHPELIRRQIPAAWSLASPQAIGAARLRAVDRALRRAFEDQLGSPELAEAAQLARVAAEAAADHLEGRPLFAGHAAQPWPDQPHLVLWQAQTLLREYRGDGHIAALTVEGVSGLEALVIHAATGQVPAEVLMASRRWSSEEWDRAVDDLRSRGWVSADGLTLTDAGSAHRQWVEDTTDRAAMSGYAALGPEGCERLRSLARPFSQKVIDAGLLVPRNWDEG